MLDRLPPDILAVLIDVSGSVDGSLRALAFCSHDLAESLRLAQPRLTLRTSRPEDALTIERACMWRLEALTLVDPEEKNINLTSLASAYDRSPCPALEASCDRRAEERRTRPAPSLDALATCMWLTELTLDRCELASLLDLAAVPRLAVLRLRHLQLVSSLAPLVHCPWLRQLELTSCWRVGSLADLAACHRLERLETAHFKGSSLPACPALAHVRVTNAPGLTDLWGLRAACASLRHLSCSICHALRDLSGLANAISLEELELDRCTGVRDLRPLATCAALRTLTLSRCPGLVDLAALAVCASLQELHVRDCSGLAHVGAAPCRVARALARFQRSYPRFGEF